MHSSIFKAIARKALKGKWQKTAWILFVGSLISGGIQVDAGEIKPTFQLNLNQLNLTRETISILLIGVGVCLLLALMVGSLVGVGMYNLSSKLLNGEEPRMKMLFPGKVLWRAVLMNLLRALLVFGPMILVAVAAGVTMNLQVLTYGLTAAYIPAFFLSYCYDMADYLLLEESRLGPVQALRESRRRMKGFKSNLFWLELSFIGWALLSMIPQLVIMSVLVGFSTKAAIVAGFASSLVCSAFLTAYQVVAKTAFFREVSNPDDGYAKRRAQQQEAARAAFEEMQRRAQQAQAEAEPAAEAVRPSVDYDKAQDLFLEYRCSRAAMHEAGVLEEYEAIGVDSSMESRWMRDYADQLIRRFDRDAETLSGILRLASEYAHSEILDRALMRIDRHVRQQTLPAEEILGMAGRALALIKSGRFDENPGYAERKSAQIAEIVSRIEESSGESETIAKIREML